jgi:hypothetical protein
MYIARARARLNHWPSQRLTHHNARLARWLTQAALTIQGIEIARTKRIGKP